MVRLGLQRDASLDFTALYEDAGVWQGWVWVARSE
jgi:hypothetical protein